MNTMVAKVDPNPYELADTAAEFLLHAARTQCPTHAINGVDAAIVLGSGWHDAADSFARSGAEHLTTIPMSDIPGCVAPTAQGHGGQVRLYSVARDADAQAPQIVAVCLGRIHAYEGYRDNELWRTTHMVRTMAACGARTVVLTNAAGGLAERMRVGEPVLISDHINFTARTPLVGARFVDLTDAYSPRLRALANDVASRAGSTASTGTAALREAVYAMMPGPQYETPAEIAMLRTLGAGLVGMSTVYETIAAREAGMEVLGISLVTNLAAGISGQPLNHEEVLEAGAQAAEMMGSLLAQVVRKL